VTTSQQPGLKVRPGELVVRALGVARTLHVGEAETAAEKVGAAKGVADVEEQNVRPEVHNEVGAEAAGVKMLGGPPPKGKLYAGQYTMWDLGRKRLALHKLTYGAASVWRLLKYSSQGFTACQGCIVSLLRAVGDNPAVINSDVQYVD
jgi:hypothetical protein